MTSATRRRRHPRSLTQQVRDLQAEVAGVTSAPLTIRCDGSALLPALEAVADIRSRRASVPEFAELFLELAQAFPDCLESRWVDAEALPAGGTGECVLAFHFAQSFLDRVSALRAFDREFEVRIHGASVKGLTG